MPADVPTRPSTNSTFGIQIATVSAKKRTTRVKIESTKRVDNSMLNDRKAHAVLIVEAMLDDPFWMSFKHNTKPSHVL